MDGMGWAGLERWSLGGRAEHDGEPVGANDDFLLEREIIWRLMEDTSTIPRYFFSLLMEITAVPY